MNDKQCSSCGGFCGKMCERKNVVDCSAGERDYMTDFKTAARALIKHWDSLQTADLADAEESVDALRQALEETNTGIDRGAWSNVPSATKWVDDLRGDNES